MVDRKRGISLTLEGAVRASVAGMPWIEDTDQAAVQLALVYAQRIDAVIESGEGQEVTKALYLGPHLLHTLRALGGTPAERRELAGGRVVGGKLQQLRSVSTPAKVKRESA